jgi:uncharacterized protein (DUF1684 family)
MAEADAMTGVMPAEATDIRDRLLLADWRRRVAGLYVEVRRLAESDPAAAFAHWRAVRERLFREHPQSPVPAERRAAFVARHFPHDPALRFEVDVLPDPAGAAQAAGEAELQRLGWVEVPFPVGVRRLAVYWLSGYAGGLFVPFRDATSGTETYGGGRYLLDGAKSADLGGDAARKTLVLDFNFAYHPSCAFDPRWSCPLAPPENWLDIPIRAGERL